MITAQTAMLLISKVFEVNVFIHNTKNTANGLSNETKFSF